MTKEEKNRLKHVLVSVYKHKPGLPKFILDSTSEGLNQLVDKLIKTNFLRNTDID